LGGLQIQIHTAMRLIFKEVNNLKSIAISICTIKFLEN